MATRTWVSGVGDDVNPCSRTAPCKTFAGAVSKTAAGGEIDALDPGGFGSVTITKGITLDGGSGSGWASILAAGTSGIVINAGQNDIITLRNLSINGAGSGVCGIRILAARAVFVEDCEIFGFRATAGADFGTGIRDARRTGGQLAITGSTLRNNGQNAIVIRPASGSTRILAAISNCWLQGNGNTGLVVMSGSVATIGNSFITGNGQFGIRLEQAAGSTECDVESCVIAHNGTGIVVRNGAPTVRLSNSTIMHNSVGIQLAGETVASFMNNRIVNGSGNTPTPGAKLPLA